MKKMAIMALVAAVASAGVVSAQAPGGRGGRGPGRMDEMLLQGITLTDAQKAKLDSLHQAERAKAQAGGEQGRGDFNAIREAREKGDTTTANKLMAEARKQMESRRDERVAAVRAILTPDQQKTLDANVAEMKKHEAEMGPRGGRGRPDGAKKP